MKVETIAKVTNGISITQSIVAPALVVVGHVTGNNKLKTVGVVWCALVTADSARLTKMLVGHELSQYHEMINS